MITGIRHQSLGAFTQKDLVHKPSIFDEFQNINISVLNIESGSDADGKSLIEVDLRRNTGVTLLAVKRGTEIIEHPGPKTILKAGDIAYVIGDPEQVNLASDLLRQVNNTEDRRR